MRWRQPCRFFGIMSLCWMAFNHVGSSSAWAVMALALAVVPVEARLHERRPATLSPRNTQLPKRAS
jgi:hypothetical protein